MTTTTKNQQDENISVELINDQHISEIFSKIEAHEEEFNSHRVQEKKIKQFALLKLHGTYTDNDFKNYIANLTSTEWIKKYKEKTDIYFDAFEKKASINLKKLEHLKGNIPAFITQEEEGVIWDTFQKIKHNMLISSVFILALLFASVSFFAILYSSWDGTGNPYLRENTLEYLPAAVTALFASTGGVLLKLSTNSFLTTLGANNLVKFFSFFLALLIPIYVSLIISVVSGGEFEISENNISNNIIQTAFNNIYTVIIVHIFLEMIMVYLAMHHLSSKSSERRKIVIEENLEHKKIEECIEKQEKQIIKKIGLTADLQKISDRVYRKQNDLLVEYTLRYNQYKKTFELMSAKNNKDAGRDKIAERQIERDLDNIQDQITEMGRT